MIEVGARAGVTELSLRDPDATLVASGSRLLRLQRVGGSSGIGSLIANPLVKAAMAAGQIVQTWAIAGDDLPHDIQALAANSSVFEHARIDFVSYPAEWSPQMLCEAAALTLQMQLLALRTGRILKDATPANVVFDGPRPVFVDLPSFVRRPEGTFLWSARHQFDACFVLPLILNCEAGVPLVWSLRDPDQGVTHTAARRLLGARAWLLPRLATAVALPAAMSRDGNVRGLERRDANDARALYVLERQVSGLQRRIAALRRRLSSSGSAWYSYTETRRHYADADLDRKRSIVAEAVATVAPRRVLDIGANTGEFSAIAAQRATVVALDVDERCVDSIFERGRSANLPVSALVANFARPTPADGWDCAQRRSLLDRIDGRFDLILMLAVLHHLRVTEGIPVVRILDTLRRLAACHVLIEHVPPSDPMFRRIARGREALYADCERAAFEALAEERFALRRRDELGNGRGLYLLQGRC